jgi:ABC-type Fe3+/spermidine/putrescine transport system ATPase subunit
LDYAVELENVTKKFDGSVAVNSISFRVAQGEFFCLIGPSGCGKTTTLRLIAGLIRPDSGKILIRGEDFTNVPTYRRPISMVFQTWALFPHLSVYDNVAFGLKMRGAPRQTIDEEVKKALELVRMKEYMNRRPRELSGGQQQRVAIARALVVKPEIILLDEPLGNLDFKLQLQLQSELKQIHKELGTTFVYVTHDQRQAMVLGNRICVMNNGVIEQIDTNERVYSKPANVFVARFVGESNIIEGTVKDVGNNEVVIETELGKFKAENSNYHHNGKRVWLFWRPEHTLLGYETQNCEYVFEGKIKSIETSGQITHYLVDVGRSIIKASKPGLPFSGLEEESRIYVGIRQANMLVLDKLSSIGGGDIEKTILGA